MSAEAPATREKPSEPPQVPTKRSNPSDTSKPARYVLLVRHAARARKWHQSEKDQPIKDWRAVKHWFAHEAESGLTDLKPGLSLTYGLTGQLCDEFESKAIKVSEILCSDHNVAKQTAAVLASVLTHRNRYDVQPHKVQPNKVASDSVPPDNVPCACFGVHPALTPRKDEEDAQGPRDLINDVLKFGRKEINRVRVDNGCARPATNENLAIILVGHQPQLTMIARALLDKSLQEKSWKKPWYKLRKIFPNNSLPANVLPLGNSEIACIELGDNPRLLWLLTEKSNDLLVELKAKIASKYDVAKFFLGALVVGTGLTLGEAIWKLPEPIDKILAGCGAFAALVSLGFTAATLFSYDRLLMPQEFWLGDGNGRKSHRWSPVRRLRGTHMEGKPPRWTVSRPPSQAHLILFYEMVHTWTHFFIPAIVSAFAALGLLVVAMADNSITEVSAVVPIPIQWIPATLVGIALLAFVIGFIVFYLWKPRLGFDD
ncbi:MAG: hypothetical protein QOH42_525 [Blastocatellia bacterium]|jgi:hypothetical protein|nr:hypothetical protein [Blastocatellia bacterium]